MAVLSGFNGKLQTPTDAVIAVQTAAPASNDFATIGGLSNFSAELSATEIDITNQSSNESKEILDGRGVKALSLTFTGQATDAQLAKDIETNVLSQKLRWFRLLQSDNLNRTYTGKFKITNFSLSGSHDGSVEVNFSLMSSGVVTVA